MEPVWMTLVSAAGDSLKYLVMPYFSNLPVVFVHTPDATPVESKVRWVEDAKIVVGNAGANNAEYSGAAIRGRGNSTWLYQKKPYALKLGKRSQVLGMKRHKRWCLLANYIDKTLLRNALAFEVGRNTNSLEWTPAGEFVDLVLNGVLLGNYYLCEQIRVDENRLAITEMSSSDVGETSITGGYLLEYDTGYDETYKFYSQTCKFPVNIKEPDGDVIVEEQFEYIKAYVNEMEGVLDSGGAAEYIAYLDYETFADYWIVQAVTGNRDVANPRSAYFYKERGEVLKAGPLWDFDYRTYLPDNTEILKDYLYYGTLFEDEAFVTLVKERFAEYYPRFLALTAFMEEQVELLAESAAINEALWPEITQKINGDTELSLSEAWSRLQAAYLQRLEFLNSEISSW